MLTCISPFLSFLHKVSLKLDFGLVLLWKLCKFASIYPIGTYLNGYI